MGGEGKSRIGTCYDGGGFLDSSGGVQRKRDRLTKGTSGVRQGQDPLVAKENIGKDARGQWSWGGIGPSYRFSRKGK